MNSNYYRFYYGNHYLWAKGLAPIISSHLASKESDLSLVLTNNFPGFLTVLLLLNFIFRHYISSSLSKYNINCSYYSVKSATNVQNSLTGIKLYLLL